MKYGHTLTAERHVEAIRAVQRLLERHSACRVAPGTVRVESSGRLPMPGKNARLGGRTYARAEAIRRLYRDGLARSTNALFDGGERAQGTPARIIFGSMHSIRKAIVEDRFS